MKLKELFSVRDMSAGAPWKRILEFAIPMLIGNIAQQLYNTADSIIVGKYVGDNALSAVGSATPILNLLLALFVGISTGAGILISQSFGARDREGLTKNVGNCITLALIATGIIMIIGPLITMPMLRLLNTPEAIIYWCADYLKIYFYGIIGFFMYNMLSGVLRGLGDSFSALGFLLLAAALNVGLDLLFVAVFGMGVPGVSLATVISQAISAVFCYLKLLSMREHFDLNLRTLRLVPKTALSILRLGIPSGLTQAIMASASMVVQSLTNSMDTMVIACMVIIMRVDGFAMMPNLTFGQTMSVYTGQNVGAGKYDRVIKGCKQGAILALGTSALLTGGILLFGRTLFSLFTETPELIELAYSMMNLMAVGYLAVSITQVLGGVMRGAGDTMTPMWVSAISTILLRVPTAYLIAHFTRSEQWPNGSPFALSSSLVVSWVLGMIVQIIAYNIGKWKKNLRVDQDTSCAES